MTDFPNKIVTIILVFLLLIVSPVTWSFVRGDFKSERLVMNEMTQFLDKVTDKASITQADLDDLYFGVNATGGVYDVKVKRYVRAPYRDDQGENRTVYVSTESFDFLNTGDIVKVTVEEVSMSPAKRLLWSILRVDEGRTKISLAASVK